MKETFSISVRGKSGALYSFNFKANGRYVDEWIQDGLVIDGPMVGFCPLWVQQIGLSALWFWCQERIYDIRGAVFFWRRYKR